MNNFLLDQIYHEIKIVADLSLQEKLFLNKNNNTGLISSYTEVMCKLFDDLQFTSFVDYVKKSSHAASTFKLDLANLESLLNHYQEKGTDMEIINDPAWHKVVEQAKAVVMEWNNQF